MKLKKKFTCSCGHASQSLFVQGWASPGVAGNLLLLESLCRLIRPVVGGLVPCLAIVGASALLLFVVGAPSVFVVGGHVGCWSSLGTSWLDVASIGPQPLVYFHPLCVFVGAAGLLLIVGGVLVGSLPSPGMARLVIFLVLCVRLLCRAYCGSGFLLVYILTHCVFIDDAGLSLPVPDAVCIQLQLVSYPSVICVFAMVFLLLAPMLIVGVLECSAGLFVRACCVWEFPVLFHCFIICP